MDAEVATKIFEKAILGLHKKGKTILLILSQYRFIKYATQTFLLKNGELIQDSEELNEFILNSSLFPVKDAGSEKKKNPLNLNCDILSINKSDESFESNMIDPEINNNKSQESNTEYSEVKKTNLLINDETKKSAVKNDNEEIREEGAIKLKTLMIYIKGMGLIFFTLILMTITMMQICRNFYDIWLKEYVNYNSLFLFEDNFQLTLIVIAVFTIFWTLMRSFCFAIANLRASKNIFIRLLNSVIYSKMGFFENNAIGRIINRFSGDTQAIDDRISFESNILVNNIFILAGSLIVIILQNIYVFISNIYCIFLKISLCFRHYLYWNLFLFHSKII